MRTRQAANRAVRRTMTPSIPLMMRATRRRPTRASTMFSRTNWERRSGPDRSKRMIRTKQTARATTCRRTTATMMGQTTIPESGLATMERPRAVRTTEPTATVRTTILLVTVASTDRATVMGRGPRDRRQRFWQRRQCWR
ncbi:hypothetical protein D8S78_00310 [Natrialba swarupiae]|nr:hypothetical protein [Natrialba swarupiae]